MEKIIAIIPARGGSKRVPRKNVRALVGKPLIVYSVEQAMKSEYIDKFFVSTEDREISEISKECGAEVIKRPSELAGEETPTLPVIKHAIEFIENNKKYKPDVVVILQPTSPLRGLDDINNCIEKLLKEKCDSVITLKKVEHPPQWMVRLDDTDKVCDFLDFDTVKMVKDVGNVYIPNGAVFVAWRDVIMKHNMIRGPNTKAIIMPQERSIDIDTETDFLIVEKLMEKRL